MAVDRYRNWLFLLYPDSMPDDWAEYIEQYIMAPVFVSPLHDQDVKPNGTAKKPHFHCVVAFKGVKTFNAVQRLLEPLGGPIPRPCEDIGGALRYLCHLDNPDKARYDIADVQCFNGADYMEGIFTISDEKRVRREIKQFVFDHQIFYYSDLSKYASKVNQEWENCIDRNSLFWVSFLKSYQTKHERHEFTFIDQMEDLENET